jgi:hypothetical protein
MALPKFDRFFVIFISILLVIIVFVVIAVLEHKFKHNINLIRIKDPINEVLHCPLVFAGVHLQADSPSKWQLAYHYCKPVNDNVFQCILYDGTGLDAKLIGIEYLVSNEIYEQMDPEERKFWHPHQYEIDSGLLKCLTLTGEKEQEVYGKVRTLWGKITHTWVDGKGYPEGPSKLFWSVTGKEPFVTPKDLQFELEIIERRLQYKKKEK